MKTIILSEERVDADPRLLPCLRALFPECQFLISCGKEEDAATSAAASAPPGPGAVGSRKIRP
jgi:hypothetical protein